MLLLPFFHSTLKKLKTGLKLQKVIVSFFGKNRSGYTSNFWRDQAIESNELENGKKQVNQILVGFLQL